MSSRTLCWTRAPGASAGVAAPTPPSEPPRDGAPWLPPPAHPQGSGQPGIPGGGALSPHVPSSKPVSTWLWPSSSGATGGDSVGTSGRAARARGFSRPGLRPGAVLRQGPSCLPRQRKLRWEPEGGPQGRRWGRPQAGRPQLPPSHRASLREIDGLQRLGPGRRGPCRGADSRPGPRSLCWFLPLLGLCPPSGPRFLAQMSSERLFSAGRLQSPEDTLLGTWPASGCVGGGGDC